MVIAYILASALAFLLARYGTPIARSAALRFGVVDQPDGNLKNHAEPVPYFGGLAIYLAVLIPLCLFYEFDARILSILLAGTLVLLLGLIDDFGVLTPGAKFVGQIIAAIVLVKGDVIMRVETFPLWLNLTMTMLWLVGMTNALNIIDIMDGLAAGIALIGSLVLFVVALINHDTMIAIFTATLAGGLIGFLPYNFRPARIYMGDTGSMFLGLTLGTLAIIGDYSDRNRLAFLNPLLIFGVAIFDTIYVMILRVLQGRTPFLGSRDHFAVRLKLIGWPVDRIVLGSYLMAIVLGGAALLNIYLPVERSIALYGVVLIGFVILGWRLSKIQITHGN
ncbi:MAG TPA: MraY family glycosyltransferase [Acidobacteriota bacterium]|nr:MraY family glycosyltransferase [Acidobacteriota bacterium]